jgi:uncharacterized Zn finger protein
VSRESANLKARRYLAEGRLRVREADEEGGIVHAECRGDSGAIYVVGYDSDRRWSCTCPTFGPRCSHVRALQLITVMEPRS